MSMVEEAGIEGHGRVWKSGVFVEMERLFLWRCGEVGKIMVRSMLLDKERDLILKAL